MTARAGFEHRVHAGEHQRLGGIDVDQQTALLTQYQNQYEATAQLMSSAKAMYATLITMMQRHRIFRETSAQPAETPELRAETYDRFFVPVPRARSQGSCSVQEPGDTDRVYQQSSPARRTAGGE